MKKKRMLSEIWNNLNDWKWDNRLGCEPDDWGNMGYVQKSEYIAPIHKLIERIVPYNIILHYRMMKVHSCGHIEAILRSKGMGMYIDRFRDKGFIKLNILDEQAYRLLKSKDRTMTRAKYIGILNIDMDK